MDILPKQDYPIRRSVHPNTAFGIAFEFNVHNRAQARSTMRLLLNSLLND